MAKVAVIIDEDFEDSEYTKPVKALKDAGHEIIHVGLKKGKRLEGKKEGTKVTVDISVMDASANDFDALFIPGGYSPDHVRVDKKAVEFTKEFMDKDKPVFSICHGVQLLITAQVLKNRKVTGWKSLEQDIKNSGAIYQDKELVEDGNLISSRQPDDLPVFSKAIVKALK